MALQILNPRPEYRPTEPVQPPPSAGYLHLAAAVDPPLGRTPFPRHSPAKAALLDRLKSLAGELQRAEAVGRVTVYRAALMPPVPAGVAHPARYDVAVLVETGSVDVLDEVAAAPAYRQLVVALTGAARDVHVMAARCLRYLGEVDKTRPGLFLFNYFTAADPEVAVRLWDHLAAWYAAETGMDNSTLLAPVGEGDYVFVNHARWDLSLPRFAAAQFGKRSFRSYVLANLRANHTVAMPVLYRLA